MIRNLGVVAVAAFLAASCSNQAQQKTPSSASAVKTSAAQQALLQTDLVVDAGIVGNAVNYQEILPPATVAGTIAQSFEASWDPTIHNLYAAPVYPQNWSLTYYAGATALGAAPTTAAGWQTVSRVVATGSVTSDGIDGERQALVSSITAPPVVIAASFSGGSAGDGWDTFFDPQHTRVFNVHHHDSPATIMCRNLADSSTCPGYPMALDHTHFRATARFDDTSLKIWEPTANSNYLAWDCVDSTTGARCTGTPVVRSTQAQRSPGQYVDHADPVIIGRKMYAVGRTPSASVITCLDMANATECTGVTLPANGDGYHAGLAAVGTRLYVTPGESAGIDCYESTTMQRCPGTWPVASYHGPVWGVPNGDGSVTNICSDSTCYSTDGTATTLPANFRAFLAANPVMALSYTGIQYGKATSMANLSSWTIYGDRIACWNLQTDTTCSANFPIYVGSVYAPTFDPQDTDCLWTNGDDGVIRNWRISTGTQGCSGGPPKISFKASISVPRLGCDPATRVWQYKSFKLTAPTPAQYTSAALTVRNSNGAPIPGWIGVPIPSATATVDLTTLNNTLAGSTPTFEVAAPGFTNTALSPGADFRVTTGATPQMCFSLAGPSASCPATAGIATANAGSTQNTTDVFKGNYTLSGGGSTSYTEQDLPSTVPDTTPYVGNCGGTLTVSAKNAASGAAPGVVVALLDASGTPVQQGGSAVTATTDASGTASFSVWANVAYKVKTGTTAKYQPVSMTVISGGLGITNASGGNVTSNNTTPPLSSSASVFLSVIDLTPAPPTIASPTGGVVSNKPLVQGACVTGNTVNVYESGTSLCTATCAASTYSCRTSQLTDGSHTITATQTNGAGESAPSASATFTVQTVTLTVTAGTTTFNALSPAVVIDPNLTVTGTGTISGATVTVGANFSSGDVLAFVNQNGITGSWDSGKGILTLTGTATPAQYQAALASVTFNNTAGATPATATRTLTFALGTAVSYSSNAHFYEYVSGGSWTWLQAQAAAASRSYFGLQGYLVTVTSAAENAYVSSKLQGAGWMGATAPVGSVFPRDWTWATGPEAGQKICNNTAQGACAPYNSSYTDWNSGEPNNSGNAEPRAQFLANGLWNDLPDGYGLPGYVVEYGGLPGEPALAITGSRFVAVNQASVITVSPAPTNGTVTCTSPVVSGTDATCTISPAIAYRLSSLTDNGVDVTSSVSAGTYTITASTGAHTIAAVFVYVPPVLTVSTGTTGYDALGAPVTVDSALSLVGPGTITGATVTIGAGFASGDVLTFVNQNGITGSYDSLKGILTLTGTAAVSDYQTALASVTYSNTAGAYPATALRTVTFAVGTAVSYQANAHFYEYVSGGSWTWLQAQTAAAARSYYGLKGYLVTIGDDAENAYVSSKLRGAGWMGAATTSTSGLPSFPRTWVWATGPETGTAFCLNSASGTCSALNGGYSKWNGGEPNNSGDEYRAQFLANGLWNDLSNTSTLPGYVVEYGGSTNDPALSILGSKPLQVRAATHITLTSSLNASEWMQDVTFTATFAPAASTGTAQFSIDGSPFGAPVTIAGGAAVSGTINILTIGTHSVTVAYLGDVERQPANAGLAGGQLVLKASNGGGLCTVDNAADVCVSAVCDPDGKCGYANADGPCTPGTAATVCRTGVCDPDGSCGYADGDGTCTAGTATPTCRSGFCGDVSGICRANAIGGCGDDRDCSASQYCDGNTFTCLPKVASGGQLPNDPRHNAGVCTAPVGAAVCVGGACETGDNACGVTNTHACSTDANCRSGVCGADKLCGVPNAGSCTVSTQCRAGVCSNGTCGAPNGASCAEGAACLSGICGADQRCGVPNGGACAAAADCRAGFCAADGRCGEPNGGACTSGDVCRGGSCQNGHCGSSCSTTSDCAAGTFCTTGGTCAAQLPNGGSCTAASQCASGLCAADGKCGGATGDACSSGDQCRGGSCQNGTCGSACSDSTQCAQGLFCSAGSCVPRAPNGTACTAAAQCASNVCGADGKCGATDGYPCAGAADCRSGICDAQGTCDETCASDRDCLAGNYCDSATHACVAVRTNGGACAGNDQCVSLVCDTDGVCGGANGRPCGLPDNCRSGVCAADGQCGTANAAACASALTCRSNLCDADGKCGGEPGTACATSASCRAGLCGADGKCGEPNGSPCAAATDCRSGHCAADGICGDDVGAACTTATTCRTASCVAGQCSHACSADADCASGAYCDTGVCKAQKANGATCARLAECTSALCGADGACGGVDGTSCTAPAQCRSGGCSAGSCGSACTGDTDCAAGSFCASGTCSPRLPNGQACTAADQCASNVCVAGSCGVPVNQPCSSAAQCRSAICDDATGGCAATCSSNSECQLGFYCDASSHACLPAATNSHSPLTLCTSNSQCTSGICGPDGACGLPDGSQCVVGSVCRGNACVSGACASVCASDAQCASGDYCTGSGTCATKLPNGQACTKASACVAGTCSSDGKCGTPDTQACSAASECRGGACSNGTCGKTCQVDGECVSGSFCSQNSCVQKYPAGTQCSAASQCQAGVCAADGRCGKPQGDSCAAATQCRSQVCSAGQCASACALDTDCPSGDFCDPTDKVCLVQGPNGTGGPRACAGPADCASGVCASDFTCGYPTGGGSCNGVNGHDVCRSATCSPSTGTCVPGGGAGCATDTDCASGTYCDAPTLTCVAKLPAGTLLPTDALHNQGVCTPAVATAVCAGGVCDTADNRCGLPNARACTAANQCRSGLCGADGFCGAGNGTACTQDGACRSGSCVAGQCGHPNGDACTAASQCVSGICDQGTCGKPNGLPCAAASDCASGQCASDGFCGQPDGGGCISGNGCRSGACVQNFCSESCTADAQCATGLSCQGGSCLPKLPNGGSCSNDSQCASGTCAAGTCGKATGETCTAAGQCQSNTCSGGVCSSACTADGDCLGSAACVAGLCTPKGAGGTACTSGTQCAAGVCIAGTCGKLTGQACTAPSDCHSNICDSSGTCADTCAKDGECPAATYCGPTHACVADAPNGQPCTDASHCASGVCTSGSCGYPDGQGACTGLNAASACQSGACGSASHTCVPAGGNGCSLDADCDAHSYCVPATRTCASKLANGQAIPNDALHDSGACSAELGKKVCASGVCDTQDDLCGQPNDAVCTSNAQCRGGACGADGRCGSLNGNTCASNAACRSGVCDADGKCGSNTGSCSSGADCRGGVCFGADQHCGLPSGTACATNAQCRGGVCGADGLCGAPNGDACTSGDACRSGACVSGHCGAPCTADSQCGAATFCQSGSCVTKEANGTACTAATQCASGVCGSDHRCGGTTGDTCTSASACRVACTNGSCSDSCSTSSDCASGTSCKAGACVAGQANGAACTLGSQCAAGVCAADGTCGAPSGAACVRPQNCRSGICDADGLCADSCTSSSECVAGDWCNPATHACAATATTGGSCSSGAACASGTCGSNGQCGGVLGDTCSVASQCQSGVCDPTDLRCGLANGSSGCTDATAANVCRSGVCVNGTCGLQDGATCGADSECASGYCSAARVCAQQGTPANLNLKGGTGCSSTTGGVSFWAVLALLGLVVRRARRSSAQLGRAAVAVAAVVAGSSYAQTQTLVQGFAAQNFDPAYAGDAFFAAPSATTEGHLLPSVRLTFDYANQPVRITSGGTLIPNGVVVRDQFWAHLDVSLALIDRLRFDLSAPMALYQSGDAQSSGSSGVQGGRLGDLRLGLRGAVYGKPGDLFALGVQGDLLFPSGSREDFAGAGTTRGQLRVIASGGTSRIIYSAALGLQLTPHRSLGVGDVGSSLTYQAGLGVLFFDQKFQVGPEFFGSSVLASGTSPLELLVGARYRAGDFVFGAGIGPGLTGAASAAVWRGLLSLAYEPKPVPPATPCVASKDESATRDSDGDGIADKVDACQFVAGSPSANPAKNGCPADSDGDGILDAQDACPNQAGLAERNGCPAPADRDHDGIPDADDQCPDVAGPADGAQKGCPAPADAALKGAKIELAERVEFANDKAELLPASENVLRAVVKVMNEHPELTKVSIEGYTDNRGNPAYNVQLSADRAASVLAWLAKNGVDKSRLVSAGFGAEKPVASNDDEAGRQRNRRVELRVIERKDAP